MSKARRDRASATKTDRKDDYPSVLHGAANKPKGLPPEFFGESNKEIMPQPRAKRTRQESRIGKHLLSGHFGADTVVALQELLLDERRAKGGERVTVQAGQK